MLLIYILISQINSPITYQLTPLWILNAARRWTREITFIYIFFICHATMIFSRALIQILSSLLRLRVAHLFIFYHPSVQKFFTSTPSAYRNKRYLDAGLRRKKPPRTCTSMPKYKTYVFLFIVDQQNAC